MIPLNKPSLKGTNDHEKIEELRRYLFTLVDDLQFALQDLEKQINGAKVAQASAIATADYTEATPDAMAFDGEAYSGEEMPTIPEGETIEEGDESNEQG
jgi:hypothetical protein